MIRYGVIFPRIHRNGICEFYSTSTVIGSVTSSLCFIFSWLRKACRVVSSGIAALPSVIICLEFQPFSIRTLALNYESVIRPTLIFDLCPSLNQFQKKISGFWIFSDFLDTNLYHPPWLSGHIGSTKSGMEGTSVTSWRTAPPETLKYSVVAQGLTRKKIKKHQSKGSKIRL